MEAFLSSTNICKPSLHRFVSNPPRKWLIVNNRIVLNAKQGDNRIVLSAKQGDREDKPVKENLITLRMSIKKTKKLETCKKISQDDHHHQAPAPSSEDWMKWERKLFDNYHEDVREAIQVLQTFLLSTRPGVVLAILSLVAIVPVSSSPTLVANAIKIIRGILAGCHISIDIDF